MPKVGKKHFSYSDKGKAEAKAYAEKTGQNIEKGSSSMAYESNDARNRSESYKEGGKVEKDEYIDVKDKRSGDIYNPVRKKKGIKGALERIVPGGKSGYEKKKEKLNTKPKMRKSYTVDWSKKPSKGQLKDRETGEAVRIKSNKKKKK